MSLGLEMSKIQTWGSFERSVLPRALRRGESESGVQTWRRWLAWWENEKEIWRRQWIVLEREREEGKRKKKPGSVSGCCWFGFCAKSRLLGLKHVSTIWLMKNKPLGRFTPPSERTTSVTGFFVRLWRVNGKSSGVQIRWFLSLFHMELNYLRNPKVRIWKLGKLQNGTIPGTLTGTKLRRSNGWVF